MNFDKESCFVWERGEEGCRGEYSFVVDINRMIIHENNPDQGFFFRFFRVGQREVWAWNSKQ